MWWLRFDAVTFVAALMAGATAIVAIEAVTACVVSAIRKGIRR